MAHEITTTDNLFSVREMPWHRLGHVLKDYPTLDEAKKIAHPWEPVSEPLYRRIAEIRPHVCTPSCPPYPECNVVDDFVDGYEEVKDWVANVRDDNGDMLGVATSTYGLVLNSVMYDVAEALESESKGDVMCETGGSFNGGRKVWLMLRLKEPLKVPGDRRGETVPYYTLQNSHDGSGSFRGQATMVRVVCANTSHLADLDAKARGTEFTFRHTLNVRDRIDEAKRALQGWREGLESWQIAVAEMVNVTVTDAQIYEFIDRFIPMPAHGLITERVVNNVTTAREQLREVMYASETNVDIIGTAYGLVQGASEWSEHIRAARTEESRFKRAVLDRNQIITKAQELAYEIARSA